jgi:hypothetical protein
MFLAVYTVQGGAPLVITESAVELAAHREVHFIGVRVLRIGLMV